MVQLAADDAASTYFNALDRAGLNVDAAPAAEEEHSLGRYDY